MAYRLLSVCPHISVLSVLFISFFCDFLLFLRDWPLSCQKLPFSIWGDNNSSTEQTQKYCKAIFGTYWYFRSHLCALSHLWIVIFSSISFDFSNFKSVDVFVSDYNLRYIIFLLRILLSIKFCLPPVTLFFTSLAFRRHFKRYLNSCC